MSKSYKYFNELTQIVENLNKNIELIGDLKHESEKEVSLIYHEIENTKFNASEGYLLAKRLQEVLRKRREIKQEIEVLDIMRGWIGAQRINVHRLHTTVRKVEEQHEDDKNKKRGGRPKGYILHNILYNENQEEEIKNIQ